MSEEDQRDKSVRRNGVIVLFAVILTSLCLCGPETQFYCLNVRSAGMASERPSLAGEPSPGPGHFPPPTLPQDVAGKCVVRPALCPPIVRCTTAVKGEGRAKMGPEQIQSLHGGLLGLEMWEELRSDPSAPCFTDGEAGVWGRWGEESQALGPPSSQPSALPAFIPQCPQQHMGMLRKRA